MPGLLSERYAQRWAKIKALTQAAEFLEHNDPTSVRCCGAPLSSMGECSHRPGHATPGNVNIADYPDAYTSDGTYLSIHERGY